MASSKKNDNAPKKVEDSPKKEQLHVPKQWLVYKPLGEVVKGTRFIPFKTPLCMSYFNSDKSVTKNDYFTIDRLMEQLKSKGLNLGLVVDLTSTSKYYNAVEWEKHGVTYAKIASKSDNLIENRKTFFSVVNEFIKKDNERLIGVHCAHGLNRTGFLICSYLVEYQKYTIDQAILDFEAARGHEMEQRKDILRRLYPINSNS